MCQLFERALWFCKCHCKIMPCYGMSLPSRHCLTCSTNSESVVQIYDLISNRSEILSDVLKLLSKLSCLRLIKKPTNAIRRLYTWCKQKRVNLRKVWSGGVKPSYLSKYHRRSDFVKLAPSKRMM